MKHVHRLVIGVVLVVLPVGAIIALLAVGLR